MVGFPLDSRVTYVTDPDTGAITPQYDRAVTSKPLRAYIRGIITTGVLPNPSDNLQVFPGTDGMTVIVHAGFAVIDGGLAKEDNNRTLEVTASDATYDRIDTVVVRWNDNDSVRNVDLYIKQGVPARNPVRPTLTREGSVYEIGLADIFVTKNVRTITAEKITDTRLESSRCGVASSIAKWDTTTIYQQIQSDLAGFKSNEQAEFMTWFNKMKDQLTTDAAGKLQTEVDDVTSKLQNLQVGGRNLYLGSREFEGIWNSKDKWNFLSEKYNGFRVASNKEAWDGLCQDVTVDAGDVYTISAYIKNTSETRFYASNTGKIDKNDFVIDNSSDFRRVVITFTVKTGGVITPRFEESKGTTDGLQICGIKLERGNVATDWSPAPEDLADTPITNSEIDTILNS